MHRTLVIVNPHSGNGRTGRRWAAVEDSLRSAIGAFDLELTRAPRDAERLAREGARAGVERLIVAGGDGTLSEVVSGLLAADLADRVHIGLLPLGTGGDFPRSLGAAREIAQAIEDFRDGAVRRVDAGRARYLGPDGQPRLSYFANVASLGIGALTSEIVNQTTKVLGGTVSFLIGTLRALVRYRSRPVRIRVDGKLVHDAPMLLATAANGRYFGGGMQVAPRARIDDGELDVVIVIPASLPRLVSSLPDLYRGTHLDNPIVRFHRGRVVDAEATPGEVKLELDGEVLGCLPARFDALPSALAVIGPKA